MTTETLTQTIERWLRRLLADDPKTFPWLTVAVQDAETLFVQWATDGPRVREEVGSHSIQADQTASSRRRHDQLIRLGYHAPDKKEINYWRELSLPLDVPATALRIAGIFESVFDVAPDAAYEARDESGDFEVARPRPHQQEPPQPQPMPKETPQLPPVPKEPPQLQPRSDEPTTPEREARRAPERGAGKSDPYEALRKLAALRADGIITDAEFEQKKADLLDRI